MKSQRRGTSSLPAFSVYLIKIDAPVGQSAVRSRGGLAVVSTGIYTWRMETIYHAKLFRNGGSQAVRLPKEVRFEGQREVLVRKEGRRVILEPKDEWPADFVACLGAWDEPIERPGPSEFPDLVDPFG